MNNHNNHKNHNAHNTYSTHSNHNYHNNNNSLKDLSIYVHIPFCKSRCKYCDFNSYAGMEEYMPEYFNALYREIYFYRTKDRIVRTVYIGGGTPTIADPGYISRLLGICREAFFIDTGAEITIESNPGTLNGKKLETYASSGINRVSLGLQCWQYHLLKKLGRIHTSRQFEDSVRLAREAGFENINADIIFAVPGQTIENLSETLEKLVELDIPHISVYSLTIEEGTPLYEMMVKGEIIPVEDSLDREMYHMATETLSHHGYIHYEISNFAKPGYESRHNTVYWKCGEYLGFGAGAHSYFNGKRYNNINNIFDYSRSVLEGTPPAENFKVIDLREQMTEYIILGLRMLKGIDTGEFRKLFKTEIADIYPAQIKKLERLGLLKAEGQAIKLTKKGLDLANMVFTEFI